MFVIAQVFALIAWIFFLMSYFGKDINKVLILLIVSDIFYCLNYLCLNAFSGLLVSCFDLIKEIGYYKTKKRKYIFYFTIPVYILIAFYSEKSILMIVPILASIIDGYSILKSKRAVVIGGIISNSIWIIYDFYYLVYVVVLSDLMIVIANIGILLYGYNRFIENKKYSK